VILQKRQADAKLSILGWKLCRMVNCKNYY